MQKVSDVEFIEFFTKKINWKFLNFLKDKLVDYEDLGLKTDIDVISSRRHLDDMHMRDREYVYNIGRENQRGAFSYFKYNGSTMRQLLDIKILIYEITIYNNNFDINLLNKYKESVVHRCEIFNFQSCEDFIYLAVTPKK